MLTHFFKYHIKKNEEKIKDECKDVCYVNMPLIKNMFEMEPKYNRSIYSKYVEFNPFIHPVIQNRILNIYCKSVQSLQLLKRVCIRYIRKRRHSFSSTDLSLNSLENLQPRELIDIMHNYNKYTFKVFDLSNIIFNSLINADEYFFSNPLTIKNPYTNIKFSVYNLYIIYFCMLQRGYIIHPLFALFMKENFNLSIFSLKYEGLIKEYIIDNKIKQSTNAKICGDLRNMFTELSIYNLVTLSYEVILHGIEYIPDDSILTFKPLLYHYNHSLYSMNSCYRHVEYNKLIKKIIAFKNENPLFTITHKIIVPITKVNYKHITIPRRSYTGWEGLMLIPGN